MVQYQATLDRTFSALADPTRRDILERIGRGPATISELAEPYGMSLTGLKKHVRILEAAELVTTEKIGRTRECRLGPGQLEDAAQWIEMYRRHWDRRLDKLEAYYHYLPLSLVLPEVPEDLFLGVRLAYPLRASLLSL